MKTTLITTYNWYQHNAPEAVIAPEVHDILVDHATATINEMTTNDFTSGELIATVGDDNTQYMGQWSVESLSTPQALYNHLVKDMKANLITLIRKHGVQSKFVNHCRVINIAEYEFELAGELIEEISETNVMNEKGHKFNYCFLETELERVLEIIEDIQNSK